VRRRSKGAVAAGIVLALLAVLAWRSVVDLDFGIHMASGAWIAQHGQVPQTDPFTYTVADRDYVAYHWLFQLAVHELSERFGVPGVVWARWGLLVVLGLLLADLLRVRGCSPLAAAVIGTAAIFAAEWRFTLRPELVSDLLAASTLWILERRRLGRRSPLWLLPVIQLVWVNTHVYVLGWAILAPYLLEEVSRRRTWRTPVLAWSAASALAVFANPYHVRGVLHPLLLATRMQGDNVFAQTITELASPLAIGADPLSPFSTGLQLSAYRGLLLFGIAAVGLHLWRRRWIDAALVGIFGLLSVLAVRNLALYAIVALPSLAVAADEVAALAARRGGAPRRGLARLELPALVLVLGFALLCIPRIVSGTFYASQRRPDRFAAELCRSCLAADAADWIAARDLRGRGFNDLTSGSTLIWRDPGRKVFIDGRNEVTGEAFFRRYLELTAPGGWPAAQREFGFEYAVMTHRASRFAGRLATALRADPDWRMAYVDGAAVVFVRVAGPNGQLPEAPLPAAVDAATRSRALERASLASAARPGRWLWSREPAPGEEFALGSFLLRLGLLDEAEAPLLASLQHSPHFFETCINLGVLYHYREQWKSSLAAYRIALALRPDHPELAPLAEALRGGRWPPGGAPRSR
jgi:hypothetical protein